MDYTELMKLPGLAVLPDGAPLPTSPEWHDYVMSLFTEDEIVETDKGKFPKVSGLRRLAELLIGRITESGVEKYSTHLFDSATSLGRADCIYRVVFGNFITFKGLASAGPTNSGGFNLYPEALAETRAEARALRKALKLKVCGAEELEEVTDTAVAIDGVEKTTITDTQKSFIEVIAGKLGIDVNKFLKVKDVNKISYSDAVSYVKKLNDYQQKKEVIPQEIKI